MLKRRAKAYSSYDSVV